MAHLAFPLSASGNATAGFAGWMSRVFLTLELVMQVRKERRTLQQLSDAVSRTSASPGPTSTPNGIGPSGTCPSIV